MQQEQRQENPQLSRPGSWRDRLSGLPAGWRRVAEAATLLAGVALLTALCLPASQIRLRGQELRGRVGGYEYETDSNSAMVTGLQVTDVWMAYTLRLQWNYTPLGTAAPTFYVERRVGGSGSWTLLGSTTNRYWQDSGFGVGAYVQYGVSVVDSSGSSLGLPSPPIGADPGEIYSRIYGDGTNYKVIHVTVLNAGNSADQTADGRLDPRYSTLHYVDFPFGDRVYQGGLFAGYAADPSQVGRSFLQFNLAALPSGQSLWCASVNSYVTATVADGSTTLGCSLLSDVSWSAPTLVWSTQPTFDPTMPAARVTVYSSGGTISIDNGLTYIPTSTNWTHWLMTTGLGSVIGGSGACTAAIASTSEGTNGWVYLAKTEFNSSEASCALIAYGGAD